MIQNPILPGFFPDPSFIRVGEDYYICNSTFEWFPGVVIHHSKDLKHWRLIGHALTTPAHADLRGVLESAGIWAPSLSYSGGLFYLVYTIVRTRSGPYKDVHNYLITAPNILGPWSAPIYLNSSGFDPALFHDDDGKKWLVNIQWDHRKGHFRFAGIVLQQYDPDRRRLTGPISLLAKKPDVLEGPNLYKHGDYYYLMMAEGGTSWGHGISMARAKSVTGPYELDPQPLVLTSRKSPGALLQKAGHGEIVQTPAGEWYLAHLCARPLYPEHCCPLGRETALQKVAWSAEGWLRLASGGTDPQPAVPSAKGLAEHPWPKPPARDDFDGPTLAHTWSALRVPIDPSWASLSARPGWLRLRGRESTHSLFEQSLLARRQQSVHYLAETCLEFEPTHYSQAAGLIAIYDTRMHFYLRVTHEESRGKVLGIEITDDGVYSELPHAEISVAGWKQVYLRARVDEARLQFSASPDGRQWRDIGPVLNAARLCDEYGATGRFTGALVGICAQDTNAAAAIADFDYFTLEQDTGDSV